MATAVDVDLSRDALGALAQHFACASTQPADADDFPCLLALASTCRTLRDAIAPAHARLAKACWLRAFGSDSLGACAAWQRIEQLGGSAFEERWRWLQPLRRSGWRVTERVVQHDLPTQEQLLPLMQAAMSPHRRQSYALFIDPVTGAARESMWRLYECGFVAIGTAGAALEEAFVCLIFHFTAVHGTPVTFTFSLQTGALLRAHAVELALPSHGSLAVVGQYADRTLFDTTSGTSLHELLPNIRARGWGDDAGAWSADGELFAVCTPPLQCQSKLELTVSRSKRRASFASEMEVKFLTPARWCWSACSAYVIGS